MPYPSYKFVGAKFLESGNLLSDSYTFIRTLTRLTIFIITVGCQSNRLLVYDIVNLVTVSLLLVTIIRFVLEPIGFACITALIHLSSYCNQYTSSRNRD